MSQAPLPADVMELIRKIIKLVDLISWQPSIRLNTAAAILLGEPSMLYSHFSNYDAPDIDHQGTLVKPVIAIWW
jgi:hypothetical protein